ncbi:MAG: hypothetical protein AAB796_01335 [Patescibacteria group bacterium]|mgnify:FL=1
MYLGFIDLKTLYLILHLFGIALGAGAAFFSDIMFFSAIKDMRFSNTEIRFLKLGSRTVWIGLCVLVISGVLLFMTDPARYAHSSKFLAKMTIVAIIVVNGYIFHRIHIPRIMRHAREELPSSEEFKRKSISMFASGAVSVASWISAAILGAFKKIPYDYIEIMMVYMLILSFAVFVSFFLHGRYFPKLGKNLTDSNM